MARAAGVTVELASERLRVVVDTERGAQIAHLGAPGGDNVLFAADWDAPLPAGRSTGYGSDELDWLSEYRGGWQELFPNAGPACAVDGTPLPFHGEASVARWDVLEAGADSAVLRVAARLPLVLERRMWLEAEAPVLRLEERVRNVSPLPQSFLWGHHPAFPAVAGTAIDLPGGDVHVDDGFRPSSLDLVPGARGRWPHAEDVDLSVVPPGPAERYCYVTGLPEAWAAVRGPGGRGLALAWDGAVWPHVWLWLQLGGRDFPWFGRAAVVAVEPQRAFPGDGLAGAIGRGQALTLAPGESLDAWLTAVLLEDERPVSGVTRDGRVTRNPIGGGS
jgi:galactose mutarotase-like enzyme